MRQIAPCAMWAGISPKGRVIIWTVRPTRAEAIQRVPMCGLPADDYRRLGPVRAWRKCYRDGWRVVRVIVRPSGDGGSPDA